MCNSVDTGGVENEVNFWEDYQKVAWSTCIPSCQNREYLTRGLLSEAGELCGKFKKKIRGDYADYPERFIMDIKAEVGDIFWYTFGLRTLSGLDHKIIPKGLPYLPYVSVDIMIFNRAFRIIDDPCDDNFQGLIFFLIHLCGEHGFTIEEAAEYNMKKLAERYKNNKITGNGDYR